MRILCLTALQPQPTTRADKKEVKSNLRAFEILFHTLRTPMVIVSDKGEQSQIIRMNQAFAQLAGYTEQELAGTSLSELLTAAQATLSDGRVYPHFLLQAKNNDPISVELSYSLIEYEHASAQLVIAHDITAVLWIHGHLLAAPALSWDIIDAGYMLGEAPDHNLFNAMASSSSSYTIRRDPELNLRQQRAFSFIHEDEHEQFKQFIKRLALTGNTDQITLRTSEIPATINLKVSLLCAPFYNGDGNLKQIGIILLNLSPVNEPLHAAVKLKIAMARCSISTQQLAALTGISMQTISKLRSGKITKPQRLTAQLIARELNMIPEDIWD